MAGTRKEWGRRCEGRGEEIHASETAIVVQVERGTMVIQGNGEIDFRYRGSEVGLLRRKEISVNAKLMHDDARRWLDLMEDGIVCSHLERYNQVQTCANVRLGTSFPLERRLNGAVRCCKPMVVVFFRDMLNVMS